MGGGRGCGAAVLLGVNRNISAEGPAPPVTAMQESMAGAPAGTDDHHVVGLGQLASSAAGTSQAPRSQRVGALDDVHAVVAGAGSQAGQPGQLRGGHAATPGVGGKAGRRLLVLPDLR